MIRIIEAAFSRTSAVLVAMVMLFVIDREARKCIGPASALRRVQLAHALTLIECNDLFFGFLKGFP